jgi:MoaA/NifB/PqqE/SkfB family radical SAM enzyme
MKERSKTFCVKPWIHMATYTTGEALMCCVATQAAGNLNRDNIQDIWNNQHYRSARVKMLRGEKVSACGKCYNEEEAGIKSHRVMENSVWETSTPSLSQPHVGTEYIDSVISNTGQDGYLIDNPISFDFRLGNTCNLQCVMCGPKDSSKWVNFSKQLGRDMSKWDTTKFNWVENDKFWEEQFLPLLPDIKHLILAGGEPLLLKQHTQLLERCIAEGYAKNIKIRYHTNGTIIPPHVLKLWEEFEFIDLCLSIDSWGDKNSYIRYPDLWNDICNNLEVLDNTPDNIAPRINATVNAYNVMYMPNYADWLLDRDFKKIGHHHSTLQGLFFIGYVHGPSHLNCKVLPIKIKEKIARKYDDWYSSFKAPWFGVEQIYAIKDFMLSEDKSKHFDEFKQYTKRIDNIRGTNFNNTFPELAALI